MRKNCSVLESLVLLGGDSVIPDFVLNLKAILGGLVHSFGVGLVGFVFVAQLLFGNLKGGFLSFGEGLVGLIWSLEEDSRGGGGEEGNNEDLKFHF